MCFFFFIPPNFVNMPSGLEMKIMIDMLCICTSLLNRHVLCIHFTHFQKLSLVFCEQHFLPCDWLEKGQCIALHHRLSIYKTLKLGSKNKKKKGHKHFFMKIKVVEKWKSKNRREEEGPSHGQEREWDLQTLTLCTQRRQNQKTRPCSKVERIERDEKKKGGQGRLSGLRRLREFFFQDCCHVLCGQGPPLPLPPFCHHHFILPPSCLPPNFMSFFPLLLLLIQMKWGNKKNKHDRWKIIYFFFKY